MTVNARTQMLCAWCGPAAMVIWVIGFGAMAGFIPPPSPSDSAAEVQAIYQEDTDLIRAGLFVTMMGAALLGPFVVALFLQMRRIEGQVAPLAYTQLGLGMLVVLLFVIPCMLLEAAAFRPDRDPEVTQALHDAGWLPFVGAFMPTFFELIAVAICIFQDREEKVFPRWLGYLNLWVAIGFFPTALIYFFKTGPFAWNGLLAFWLALFIFCGWFILMFLYMRRAIKQQAGEEAEPSGRLARARALVS